MLKGTANSAKTLSGTLSPSRTLLGKLVSSSGLTGSVNVCDIIKGKDGLSAYEIAVQNGFEGTEIEWLESLGVTQEEIASAVAAYLEENPISTVASVYNANTHYDFPSVGSVDVIYKAQSEKLLYQWDPDGLKYVVLGSSVEISEIECIDGGNAYGNS